MNDYRSPHERNKDLGAEQRCGCYILLFIGTVAFWLVFIYWFVVMRPHS